MRIVILFLFALVICTSCKENTKTVSTPVEEPQFSKENSGKLVKAGTGETLINLDIEIADDEYQRQTGLMYRNSMRDTQAMLFVFPQEEMRSFYMKNTRISLDLLFLDSDLKVVDFQENAQPMSEASLPSQVPAQYVLEINGGLSQQLNIEIGDQLILDTSL